MAKEPASTGSPLRPGPAVSLFLASFAVYAAVAPAGVSWMDPGELVAAGFHLGAGHPPGQPGHVLLIKLASLVPLGEVAFRAALVSAAAMAACATALFALARELVPRQTAGALVGAALFALSPPAVLDATRGEVYAAATGLLAVAALMAIRFARGNDARCAAGAAVACGLAAIFHPVIAAAFALPLAVAVVRGARGRRARVIVTCLALGMLPLCAYALLPVRAAAGAAVGWDEPTTLAGFWRAITAPAYQDNFAADGALGRFASLWLLAGSGIALGALPAGLIGLAFGAITKLRGAGVLLAGAIAAVAAAALQARINPDIGSYLLPAIAMLGVGAAIAIEAVVRALPGDLAGARRIGASLAVAAPIAGLGLVAGGGAHLDSSDDAMALVDETIGAMPPGPGLFFANSDHLLFAALYERRVAGHRPDIALANANLARDRWFLARIERALPELYVPFIDDGVAGNTAARLAVSNMREGRPVAGDAPAFGPLDPALAQPLGRGYRYLLAPATTPPEESVPEPPAFEGQIGERVAGWVGLVRGAYEARAGRLRDAARAAGIDDRYGEKLAVIPDDSAHPSLYPFLPDPRGVVIWEPWMSQLLGDDLAWRAGLDPPEPGSDAPIERRLHALWRALLSGRAEPGKDSVGVFGEREEAATALMLVSVRRDDLAERHLRGFLNRRGDVADALALLGSIVANREGGDLGEAASLLSRASELEPTNAETHARLGVVLARQGKLTEARAAWRRALLLEPGRPDVAQWLKESVP